MQVSSYNFDLDQGLPPRPLEFLMSVLPPSCASLVPKCYRDLMTSTESPIIDFYPSYFESDLNGASKAWMSVNILPFVDMKRLISAMNEAD